MLAVVISANEMLPIISFMMSNVEDVDFDIKAHANRFDLLNSTLISNILANMGEVYDRLASHVIFQLTFDNFKPDPEIPLVLYDSEREKELGILKMNNLTRPGWGEIYINQDLANALHVCILLFFIGFNDLFILFKTKR
jgi:hypothetical protein